MYVLRGEKKCVRRIFFGKTLKKSTIGPIIQLVLNFVGHYGVARHKAGFSALHYVRGLLSYLRRITHRKFRLDLLDERRELVK